MVEKTTIWLACGNKAWKPAVYFATCLGELSPQAKRTMLRGWSAGWWLDDVGRNQTRWVILVKPGIDALLPFMMFKDVYGNGMQGGTMNGAIDVYNRLLRLKGDYQGPGSGIAEETCATPPGS